LYDPASNRVFTFNGKSNDATVFDASSSAVVGAIALGGRPEFAQADGGGAVYVNIEDTAEVVEIDSRRLSVVRRFSLKHCVEPTGMALDRKQGWIYSGCRNKLMAVLQIGSGKLMAPLPIGEGVDGTGFDERTGLAFSANGEGTLTVVRKPSPADSRCWPRWLPSGGPVRWPSIRRRTISIYPRLNSVLRSRRRHPVRSPGPRSSKTVLSSWWSAGEIPQHPSTRGPSRAWFPLLIPGVKRKRRLVLDRRTGEPAEAAVG